MQRLAGLVVDQPRLMAAILIALCFGSGAALTQLGFDASFRNLFRSDNQRIERLEDAYRDFGSDDLDLLILVETTSPDGIYGMDERAFLARADAALGASEDVALAVSLAGAIAFPGDGPPVSLLPHEGASPEQVARARELALAHPIAGGRLISEDGAVGLIGVNLANQPGLTDDRTTQIDAIRELLDEAAPPEGVRLSMTGVPVVRSALIDVTTRRSPVFTLIGASLAAIIGWIALRSLLAVVVLSCASWAATLWFAALLAITGEPFNAINSVIPTIILVITFADGVHLMTRARAGLARGVCAREAAWTAIREVGPACALTSLTTAVGFASLALTDLNVIQRFGLYAAGGVVLGFLSVITIVPLLCASRLSVRLRPPSPRTVEPSRIARLLELPLSHRVSVGGIGLLVTLGALATASFMTPSTSLNEAIPRTDDTARAIRVIDERLGGVLTTLVVVEWAEGLSYDHPDVRQGVRDIEDAIRAEPLLAEPLSAEDLINASPVPNFALLDALLRTDPRLGGATRRIIRPDLRRAVVRTAIPDVGSHIMNPVHDRLSAQLKRIDADNDAISLTLTGNPIAIGANASGMIRDLADSLLVAAIVIFVIIALAMRSIVLGLLSLAPNVFPLAIAGAALVIIDHPLTVTGVITFCVCLGIAVDDTIHVLTEYRRARRAGLEPRGATREALRLTTRPIAITTGVLCAGFAPVLLSGLPLLVLFAALSCLAVSAALVGDLLVLPALLALLPGGSSPGVSNAGDAAA